MDAEVLEIFKEEGYRLVESQFAPDLGLEEWQSSVVDASNFPMAGGFAPTREQARKIAIAEFVERLTVKKIRDSSDDKRDAWGLHTHPTACGFAGGYDLFNAAKRSVAEAVERWVMSLWIDDQRKIDEIPALTVIPQLDKVSTHINSVFDSVRFFLKQVEVQVNGHHETVVVAQTMGLKDNGIFPGSSTQAINRIYWQHALLESYRHLKSVTNNPARGDVFPDNRVRFFATHADLAIEQIATATRTDWPAPQVILHQAMSLFEGRFFVARTVIDGWRSWHEGPISRFLY